MSIAFEIHDSDGTAVAARTSGPYSPDVINDLRNEVVRAYVDMLKVYREHASATEEPTGGSG